MNATRLVATATIALVLSGCWMVSFEDVSTEPAYRSLVGRQIEAPSELMLFGVTSERNYAKRTDLCVLTPRPGFDGPEVVTRSIVPAGTRFTITGVQRCTNCPFDDRVELVLSPSAETLCGKAPIKLNRSHLGTAVRLLPVAHGSAPNNSSKPMPLRGTA